MVLRGFLVAFLVSQSAWALMYVLGSNPILQEPTNILAVGSVFIPAFALLLYKLLPPTFKDPNGQERNRNPFFYMCCVFAWSCTVSAIASLEGMNAINGYFDFYLDNAEPYLGSPFGVWINLWDGTVHFALYLTIIYKYDNGKDYSKWGLYWFGSMIAGMFCSIIGPFTGIHGDTVQPVILLNMPYVVMPFYAGKHLMDVHEKNSIQSKEQKNRPISLMDIVLLIGVTFSVMLGLLRGLAGFESPLPFVQDYISEYEPYILEPGKFGAMHCIFNAVYCIPVQIILGYYLYSGVHDNRRAEMLSIILSGALAQGEFFHLKAATYYETPEKYRIGKNVRTVIFITVIPVVVGHLLLRRFRVGVSKAHKK